MKWKKKKKWVGGDAGTVRVGFYSVVESHWKILSLGNIGFEM